MERTKKPFQMKLTVEYVQATPEQARQAIDLLALMYRKFLEKHRTEKQSLLPSTSQK
jgi:hypothetical protein